MSVVVKGSRAEEWELRARVYGSLAPSVDAIEKLLAIHDRKAMQSMRTCTKDELERWQGKLAAFEEVRKWIKEPLSPIDISK